MAKLNNIKLINNLKKSLKREYYVSKSSIENHRITIISKFMDTELSSTQDLNEKITIRKLNIIKNGLPDKVSASDHLPISFTIDLGEIK